MTALRPGILVASAAAVAGAAFALWPISPKAITQITFDRVEPAKKHAASLDLAAFRAPIWVAEVPPPPPPAPVPAPPPPPPIKLQLLAIIREADVYKAAVYDPDSDRTLVVAAGEKVGTRTVEQVDAAKLTLRDAAGTRILALKEGGTP
jgi:hypothetical protein